MLSSVQKIASQHLERLAVIYLRQSSPKQVRENFRSTERQYGLAEEAARLGWEPERILTSTGISASPAATRTRAGGIRSWSAGCAWARSARSSGLRSRGWRAPAPRPSGCLSTAG